MIKQFFSNIKTATYLAYFKKIFLIKGRSSRAELGYFVGFNIIFGISIAILSILSFFLMFASSSFGVIGLLFGLSFIFQIIYAIVNGVAFLSIGIRRLHDFNFSGWWILIPLVIGAILNLISFNIFASLFGFVFLLFLLFKKGDAEKNKYGESPLIQHPFN